MDQEYSVRRQRPKTEMIHARIDPKLKKSSVGRDCLKLAEETLLGKGWATSKTLEAWRGEATRQVDDAVAKVQREPTPDPYQETWCALASKHLSEGQGV